MRVGYTILNNNFAHTWATTGEWEHLHQSERHVSIVEKIDRINSFEEENIRPTAAYRYWS